MNFGFSEEQELLRKTARDFLVDCAPMTRVREVMEGDEHTALEIWRRMAELGWPGLAFPEGVGGAGMGMVELCVVLEELGRSLAPVPFIPTVLAGVAILEAGDEAQQQAWLSQICDGRVTGTLAITEERGSEESADLNLRACMDGDRWRLDGRKLFVPDAASVDLLVVVAKTGAPDEEGLGLFLVPRTSDGVEIEEMASMDLLRPLYAVSFDGVALPAEALLGGDTDAGSTIARVLDRGRVMISAEMTGGAEKCLETNQAIKHKCADMLLEVESAKSLTYYAAWAASEANDEAPMTAAMAKAYVNDVYRHASAENIQIHGGVGFTWEYDCHLYFKRAKSDESWLGDATRQRERVAQMLEL
ncbi:MAG: acyl-CoA/acyl-ACP dehydrogenase [Deltaproteobacteria bacterium]|nr:acyl-CoA/acyl-ACP dehydrogenase [Deltaproteobacteria bacterium]